MAKVVPIRKSIAAYSNGRYVLRGKIPFPEPDLFKWGREMESPDRIVAQTRISRSVHVSTVFLGLDHAFGGGTPILFETIVFKGNKTTFMWRYGTYEAAERGHKKACQIAKGKGAR